MATLARHVERGVEGGGYRTCSLYFEYRNAATSGQSVLGWVTALSDIPIQGKMLIAEVLYHIVRK
jgi:hypothetical protein